MLEVPRSALLGCALNAWLAGRLDSDAAIMQIAEWAGTVAFRQPETQPLPAALFLGELRRRGGSRVSLSLPVAGDLQGLGGPPAFNAAALEAGEALVVHDAGIGLVPVPEGDGVVWQVESADPPSYLPDVGSAGRDLRAAVREVAEEMAELDVAAWGPDVADALFELRSGRSAGPDLPLPSAAAAALLMTALRCQQIVVLASRDARAVRTSAEAERRRSALVRLDRACRAGLIAAVSERGSDEDAAPGIAAG